MHIAVSLYEKGILDTGYAAKLIGMERNDFINQMGNYGKSIFDLPDYETEKDFLNA
jgi:predicted HTH domain antitoxin